MVNENRFIQSWEKHLTKEHPWKTLEAKYLRISENIQRYCQLSLSVQTWITVHSTMSQQTCYDLSDPKHKNLLWSLFSFWTAVINLQKSAAKGITTSSSQKTVITSVNCITTSIVLSWRGHHIVSGLQQKQALFKSAKVSC